MIVCTNTPLLPFPGYTGTPASSADVANRLSQRPVSGRSRKLTQPTPDSDKTGIEMETFAQPESHFTESTVHSHGENAILCPLGSVAYVIKTCFCSTRTR
jgi:hypothetical protein